MIKLQKQKIPSISRLARNAALTAFENKIADIRSLVKNTDYTQKLLKFKRNLLIIIMANILLFQSLIS